MAPALPIETDALIIGAGPVGLFQVFELGLLEIKAHVIDSLDRPGGQCAELYGDKPIYDIPGIPVCTGQELVDRLLTQIKPFGARFHLGQKVALLKKRDDGRFDVGTSQGQAFIAKTVFVATGAGSFEPRALKVAGAQQWEQTQIFYSVKDPSRFKGHRIVVHGGGDAALEWAAHFAQEDRAASVTLIHRRDGFQATPERIATFRDLCSAQQVALVIGQITGFGAQGERLEHLEVLGHDGITQAVPVDTLLVFLGLSPQLGPIAEWGLSLERKQVPVDTEKFQTHVPGIFAVGDVNTYPGKKKLILCGFHECALAAFAAAAHVAPDRSIPLLYTTSSSKLHSLLGVNPTACD